MPKNVNKLLVANRGEIALRVVRTAREMGIPTVAVYAEQDRHAQYVQMADDAYLLSGDTYKDTYLNEDLLIDILQRSGADAVHPGYGFLSEVATFAQKVIDAGAAWVGPNPKALVDLGDKITARRVATFAKVPPVPGISQSISDMRLLLDFAHTHGYPLMLKRTDGGGGRGITLVHNATSGVAHYLGEDEADAIDYARTVLAYLPSNSDLQPPTYAYAATRADRDVAKRLATIVPDNDRQPYDVLDVIRCIVDYGEFVQVHELFASSAVVGFACVNGHPVGIVANQPNVNAGILDVDSSEKVARFVRLCDAFNLPVVTLVDTPGYKPGAEQEHAGIIRRGAKVIYAYANAQVPLVTVILRKAFGGAYIVMGSKAIGADLNYAWPSSQIAVLGAAGAVNIIHRKDLQKAKDAGKDVEALRAKYVADYERTTVNANLSLEMGEIDAMIDPEQTRETIIESLKLLSSKKRVRKTTKHHGNQPL